MTPEDAEVGVTCWVPPTFLGTFSTTVWLRARAH